MNQSSDNGMGQSFKLICELVKDFQQHKQVENRSMLHIDSLYRQIDQQVYELYGLTEEEIEIVEGKMLIEEQTKYLGMQVRDSRFIESNQMNLNVLSGKTIIDETLWLQ